MKKSPSVYLVSRPEVDWDQVSAFLADEDLPGVPESIRSGGDESNAIVEVSARLCYMSFGRGRRDIADFIHNLLRSKDGSVFEHVNYGFVFTGVSRSLTHELVRHRAGFAYSQRSQRYVDETEGSFILPPALRGEGGEMELAREILEDACQSASESYSALVDGLEAVLPRERFESNTDRRKAIRQAARSVLPNATEDEDIRHRQRPRLEALHRDAGRAVRRLGDPRTRTQGPRPAAARGADHVRGLRGLRAAGRHSGGGAGVLEGLAAGAIMRRVAESQSRRLAANRKRRQLIARIQGGDSGSSREVGHRLGRK